MLWWFGRNEESLKLETRYDNETAEFVAIVRQPDGREQVERFAEVDDFRAWLVAFERDLESQCWTGGGRRLSCQTVGPTSVERAKSDRAAELGRMNS